LHKTDLSLGQGELPTAFSTACPGSRETSHSAFPDQVALELGQGCKDAEDGV
jgi:hypothetical protein